MPPPHAQGKRIWHLARSERAPRPSRRPLRGLLRMRLSGIGARQNYGRTLGPHPEGPPTAGVSKDGHRGIAPICDRPARKRERLTEPVADHPIAKSAAVSAWMAVVSNVSTVVSSALTSIVISVQPRMMHSAPVATSAAITS